MIGENMEAPSDLDALRETLEAPGFPLILTHYGVPFAAVTRPSSMRGRRRIRAPQTPLARIYESARLSMQGLGLPALLQRLGKDVRSSLYLIVPDTLAWQPGSPGLPAELVDALRNRRREQAELQPMVLRHPLAEGEALSIGIPSDRKPADSPGRAAAGLQLPAPPDGSARHRDRTAARRKRTPPVPGFGIARRPAATTAIPGTSRGAAGGTAARARSRRCSRFRGKFEGLATDPIGLSGPMTTACWFRAQGQEIILLHQAGLASTPQEAPEAAHENEGYTNPGQGQPVGGAHP